MGEVTNSLVLHDTAEPKVTLARTPAGSECVIVVGDLGMAMKDWQARSIVAQWLRAKGKDEAADHVEKEII